MPVTNRLMYFFSLITLFCVFILSSPFINAQATPVTPTLYIPANHSIKVETPTIFGWSAVQYAVSYNLQLADDAMMTINLQENNITSINASTTGLTPGTTYFWRVQAVDVNGITGPWSPVYTFTTSTTPVIIQHKPDLSIAANSGAGVGINVYDLSGYTQWVKQGASDKSPAIYTITISNNGSSDDVIILTSHNGVNEWKHSFTDSIGTDITNLITGTGYSLSLAAGSSDTITLSSLAGNGSSYLSITGRSSNNRTVGDTVIAQAYSISTTQQVFSRPTLVSPANNTVITGGLNWSADGTSTGYQIQVSTNANFIKPEVDQFVTSLSSTIGTLADSSTFYWRVRATDSDLALPASQYRWSEWSHVSLFRTGVATPVYSFDVNIYNRSLSGTPLQINGGSNNNQDPATQGAKSRNSAVYYIVITNRGNMSDRFTISDSAILPSDSTLSGWRINITDMRGNNITRRVLTSGSSFTTPVIDPGKKYYFRVEVAASSNTSLGDSADANIVITSSNSNAGIYTTTVRE